MSPNAGLCCPIAGWLQRHCPTNSSLRSLTCEHCRMCSTVCEVLSAQNDAITLCLSPMHRWSYGVVLWEICALGQWGVSHSTPDPM